MYPEKGPIFATSPAGLKIKWRKVLVMSEIFRLLVQRLFFDTADLTSAVLGPRNSSTESANPSVPVRQRFTNTTLLKGLCLLGDVAVGGYFVVWMTGNNGELCTGLLSSCLQILRSGVFNLTGILDWLMGNPAGLKLNKELAQTLGAFFKHHVSLWQMYISYLTSLLEGADTILCSFGFFGISFLAALVVDFISLFTVHVHCFYIYMARLYNVQLRGLFALGRFFRGKKWNPLRERVDHISSSVDQLFVGSLIMMVFVFLLPTTITFYFVFATLHVLVKLGQLPFVLLSRWAEFATGSVCSDFFESTENDENPEKKIPVLNLSAFFATCRKFFVGEII